jgi:hypothetical protein
VVVVTHIYTVADVYTAVVTASNSASVLTATTIVTVLPLEKPEYHLYLPLVVQNYMLPAGVTYVAKQISYQNDLTGHNPKGRGKR